jgi:hypothetical protein
MHRRLAGRVGPGFGLSAMFEAFAVTCERLSNDRYGIQYAPFAITAIGYV